jgi:hypothetical protein
MARLTETDERGAVYVEFLIAFFPLFLMFLAICQLALLAAADAVVRHAAFSAVRSAIVVLEDNPERFDDAPYGSLSKGDPKKVRGFDDVVAALGALPKAQTDTEAFEAQSGARMVPIRTAAQLALVPLAPSQRLSQVGSETANDHSGNTA